MDRKRILLVEDEAHLAFTLEFNLQEEGFEVTPAVNGQIALEKYYSQGPYDVIILDVNLPEKNGYEVAKEIRTKDHRTGILMLTARASDQDRLHGLQMGVDDYITKPFHLEELVMRVKRMATRAEFIRENEKPTKDSSEPSNFIGSNGIELNLDTLKLNTPKGEFELTSREAEVLTEFIKNEGKILSREHLLRSVWQVIGTIETRTVDNFVGRLRKFFEDDPAKPRILRSIRGRGYLFQTSNQHEE